MILLLLITAYWWFPLLLKLAYWVLQVIVLLCLTIFWTIVAIAEGDNPFDW